MADFAEIVERLEKLTGPDRDVECAIVQLFVSKSEADLHSHYGISAYEYTASLDAAVALVKQQGFEWLRRSPRSMSVHRELTPEQDARKEWARHFEADGATPAIALLIALFRALTVNENG